MEYCFCALGVRCSRLSKRKAIRTACCFAQRSQLSCMSGVFSHAGDVAVCDFVCNVRDSCCSLLLQLLQESFEHEHDDRYELNDLDR